MSNETNSVLNSVQAAFAPISDAFKNLQNVEVPEAARDFVKRAAGTAKDRAADRTANCGAGRAENEGGHVGGLSVAGTGRRRRCDAARMA